MLKGTERSKGTVVIFFSGPTLGKIFVHLVNRSIWEVERVPDIGHGKADVYLADCGPIRRVPKHKT